MHTRNSLTTLTDNRLLYISQTNVGSDFKASMHSHPNLEIILITSGKGKILTPRKQVDVEERDIIIINKNSTHCEISNDSSLNFLAIGVNDSDAFLNSSYLKKILYYKLNENEFLIAKNIYETIFIESKLKHEKNIILATYNTLKDIIERNSKIYFNESNNKQYSSLINTVTSILDNYFYMDIPLVELADKLSISVSKLCHEFKKETGTTILEYKQQKQIAEATNLLESTDMLISDIASNTGFSNCSYFTKTFKQCVGITPKQYRSKNKQ